MRTVRVGIVMNGVTGRMGRHQHLARSIAAIRSEGGLKAGEVLIWPDPVLVGRDAERLRRLAEEHGVERWSADLDACLEEGDDVAYFDAQTTSRREESVARAIAGGKHVYCEKPVATTVEGGLALAEAAEAASVVNGAVQDKLFLPGPSKLARVVRSGVLGRLLSVRIDFGYWVFPDASGVTQRPSWNYRQQDGGGIVLDMFCHFRYLLEHLVGRVCTVSCAVATHAGERVDERGVAYRATAEDAAYATIGLEGGVVAQVHASWCVRPHREDLFTIQVDGTDASARAGLRSCLLQPVAATPRFTWDPDLPAASDPRDFWVEVPNREAPKNAFRSQWELFLRSVALGEPFPHDLRSSVRGVQLAELALRSATEGRVLEVPELGR